MSTSIYEFKVFSGGSVAFDHAVCERCSTKACVTACNAPNLASILEVKQNRPVLRISLEQAAKGGCIECLACEMACAESGIGGVAVTLPMPELDEYLKELHASGRVPAYRRS